MNSDYIVEWIQSFHAGEECHSLEDLKDGKILLGVCYEMYGPNQSRRIISIKVSSTIHRHRNQMII